MSIARLKFALACALAFSLIEFRPALAADDDCVTGTVPEAAGDAAQILAVRALVDEGCPCLQYFGGPGKKSSDYGKCAKGVIAARLEAGELRGKCARALKRLYAKTRCGKDVSRHYNPCIETSLKTGKVKCSLKAFTERDGQTPTYACTPTERAQKILCFNYTNCIDAADSNHDLVIAAPADNGECVPLPTPTPTDTPLPTSTPTYTSTATSTPTRTVTLTPTNTPIANGAACSTGPQCASGQCVDGLCCDSSCTGSCRACSAAKKGSGSNGVCGPIASGADPDNECPTDGSATCGRNGTCNGAGACALYSSGTNCAGGSCSGLTAFPPSLCNGFGTCVPAASTNCNDGNSCTSDQCNFGICGHTNNTAACDDGVACTINDQCGGGACGGTQLTLDLNAGITHEIPTDGADGFVHFELQLVTTTDLPFQLTLVNATSPPGFVLETLTSNCVVDALDANQYRCTHTTLWKATTACQGDGIYQLTMQRSCSPGVSGCNMCSGTQMIELTSDTSNWCTTP